MKKKLIERVAVATFGLTALGLCLPLSSANAAVSIAGDSSFGITAEATVSDTTVYIGQTISAKAKLTYSALLLGIPVPGTGYYVNSIPTDFAQPLLDSANAPLVVNYYRKMFDSYSNVARTQWIVSGSEDFWGTNSVTIIGTAKGVTAGSHFFHGGTGTGHSTDANAIQRITVG
jgi:hypothetical protein